jgi:hypothetical protein
MVEWVQESARQDSSTLTQNTLKMFENNNGEPRGHFQFIARSTGQRLIDFQKTRPAVTLTSPEPGPVVVTHIPVTWHFDCTVKKFSIGSFVSKIRYAVQ